MKTKVRKIGNSLGIVLPKEALQEMHVEEGAVLYISKGPDSTLRLSPENPEFEQKMEQARAIMKRYRNTLRKLAQ